MNIILTGAPRSGTSITAAMLNKIGWNFPTDANWGGESRLLEKFIKVFKEDPCAEFKAGQQFLDGLKEQWIVKSPSFCLDMDFWERYFSGLGEPILIVVKKDFNKLMESWERLDGKKMHKKDGMFYTNANGISCREWYDKSLEAFEMYSGNKMLINYKDVIEAVKSFDLKRSLR